VYAFAVGEGSVPLPTDGTNTIQLPPVGSPTFTVRPVEFREVSIVDASNNTYPVRIIGDNEWAGISSKTAAGRPEVVYFNWGNPLITSYWYPTPMFAGDVAHFWCPQQLAQFTNLNQQLSAPQGWSRAIKSLLAMNICAGFRLEPTSQLRQMANEARRVLGLGHTQPHLLPLPHVLSERARYNIYTDE
jgi:hypothetical protein